VEDDVKLPSEQRHKHRDMYEESGSDDDDGADDQDNTKQNVSRLVKSFSLDSWHYF